MLKEATRWKRFRNFDLFVDYLENVYFPIKRLRIDGKVYKGAVWVDIQALNRSAYRKQPIMIYDKDFNRTWTLDWRWIGHAPNLGILLG